MCGITGFFNTENAVENSINCLKTIQNRGNDGFGFFDGKKLVTAENLPELEKQKTLFQSNQEQFF